MTDPTPAAPAAVPAAVREALRIYERMSHGTIPEGALDGVPDSVHNAVISYGMMEFSYGNDPATTQDMVLYARAQLERAIATALREATETRDQEIGGLTAELAAAKADTARLDWIEQTRRGLYYTVWLGTGEWAVMSDIEWSGIPAPPGAIREAIDAARAAGEETR